MIHEGIAILDESVIVSFYSLSQYENYIPWVRVTCPLSQLRIESTR